MTGSSLVEGWSAASLKPSVLAAAVLRYQDLTPGAIVEGEVSEGFLSHVGGETWSTVNCAVGFDR